MNYITYDNARELIQDGDIVSVLRPAEGASVVSWIITKVTKSPIYHTGVAVWMMSKTGEKRLFIVEAFDATRRIVPVSVYDGYELHVLAKPDYVLFSLFSTDLVERVGKNEYSYVKAIASGFRQHLYMPAVNNNGEFCSEMALKMWQKGGLPITNTALNPGQLESVLTLKYNIEYRCLIK
jgi:hypothetical protein